MHDAAGAGLRSSFSDAGRLLEGAEPEVALLAATRPEVEPLLRVVEAPREETVAGKPWWLCRFSKGAGSGTGVIIQAGYDKTNTAHALTCLLESTRPSLVLQVGIGGAFREAGLDLGDIVLATAEIYGDTGIRAPEGWISTEEFGFPLLERNGRRFWNRFPLDDGLVQRCAEVVSAGDWGVRAPRVVAGSCVTLSEISGRTEDGDDLHRRWDALLESMEGAAAAHVCAIYEVPFLEIRGVSNLVVDRERESWDVKGAAERAAQAAALVGSHLDEVLR